ncbi:MAG: cadherin-like domain-containing protein, partial [Verrucomicrobiota bacterium]
DGKILIGGAFTFVNGAARRGVARLNANGTLDTTATFAGLPLSNASTNSIVVQTDGKILVAFQDIKIGGVARYHADGTPDSTFRPPAMGSRITSLALQANGKILVGGLFTTVNGIPRNYIARLHNDPVTQSIVVPDTARVIWSRGGAAQEFSEVSFESSSDGGFTWIPLGNGSRVGNTADWQIKGLSLSTTGSIRARGRTQSGYENNSLGFIEQAANYTASDPAPAVPVTTTRAANTVTPAGATLNALVSSNGLPTQVVFQYSTDATFSSGVTMTSPAQNLASGPVGAVGVNVSTTLNGLAARTPYYFRVSATNAVGTANGSTLSFTTGNTAPVAPDGTRTATAGIPNTLTLAFPAQDADGDPVIIINAASSTRATVNSFTARTVTITPVTHHGSDGSFTYTVSDGHGGTATGTITLTITGDIEDNIVPETTITSSPPSVVNLPLASIAFSGTDNLKVAGFEGRLDGASFANVTSPVNLSGLQEGPHTYEVRARDTSGNVDPTPAVATWTVFTETDLLDTLFNPQVSPNERVRAMAAQPDGKIIIGGSFNMVGNAAHRAIARLHPDGSVDAGFTPDANLAVNCVAVQADGRIVIGGDFTTVNGMARNHIARLNADGTLDSTFNPAASVDNRILNLILQPEGKIVIVSHFHMVNGTPSKQIIRLNADGSTDSTFNADPGVNFGLECAAEQSDGTILSAVLVGSPQGHLIAEIKRFNADGTLDSTFKANTSYGLKCMVAQPDGKVVLGGFFYTVNGSPRTGLARLNADGTLDSTFNADLHDDIPCMVLQADGRILIGGSFTSINGMPLKSLARLNADGTLDSTFDTGNGATFTGVNRGVESMMLHAYGKILVAGNFNEFNGVARQGIARLNNSAATESLTVPTTAQILWSRGGTAPELSHVSFEQSTDGGGSWTPLGRGTRVGTSANWQLTRLSLPATGSIRARGRTTGGYFNGSSGLIEQVATYTAVAASPEVAASPATSVTSIGATLNATVISNGAPTHVTFQYSTDPAFGSGHTTSSPAQTLPGNADTTVSQVITGLTPRTLYYFRAVAASSAGVVTGSTLSFKAQFDLERSEEVTVTIGAHTGEPAPGAGTGALPAGSVLATFGPPAVSDLRQLAARVDIRAGRKKLSGIYRQEDSGTASLLAHQNGPAPGLNAKVTFRSFLDPLMAPDGAIAFVGRIQGDGIKANNDLGVWTDAFGNGLELVLREGSD